MTFNDIFKSSFLNNVTAVSVLDMALALGLSFCLGVFIFYVYKKTYSGVMFSSSFGVTLIAMTMITALVILAISSNVVLSLGMVGALSIVRYRTAIKDSRDTTYIFWSIVVGICCGAGDYIVAGVGSVVAFIALFILGRVRNDNRVLLIIRGARSSELTINKIVEEYFHNNAIMKVKNTTPQNIEMIYEMNRKLYAKSYQRGKSVTDRLYEVEGMEYVNVVAQSDEITG